MISLSFSFRERRFITHSRRMASSFVSKALPVGQPHRPAGLRVLGPPPPHCGQPDACPDHWSSRSSRFRPRAGQYIRIIFLILFLHRKMRLPAFLPRAPREYAPQGYVNGSSADTLLPPRRPPVIYNKASAECTAGIYFTLCPNSYLVHSFCGLFSSS